MPRESYSGDQVPIDLTIQSPEDSSAIVSVSAEGKQLGQNPVTLNKGTNQVRVHTRVNAAGTTSIEGKVKLQNGSEVQFEQAIDLKRAQVLSFVGRPCLGRYKFAAGPGRAPSSI